MATSPVCVRLASSATRSLIDTAFDSLSGGVVVADANQKHVPVVLANAAARSALLDDPAAGGLLDVPLYTLLGPGSASEVAANILSLTEASAPIDRILSWRFAAGDGDVLTEMKLLPQAPGQKWLMLNFSPSAPEPRSSHALHQSAIELMILDRDLNVTYAKAGATARGDSALCLTPTAAISRDVYARALEGARYHEEALQFSMPDGTKRLFAVDIEPLHGESCITGLIVISKEKTERRVDTRGQISSERVLLALTEHARDIITVAGPDGKLKYVSGGMTNALGYTVEERRSNYIFEHIHPEDADAMRAKFKALVEGSIDGFSVQLRIRHKDGSYRWLESSYVSALDNPLIKGVVINSRDITERKQAEAHLAQREEVFRLATVAVEGVMFEWDVARGVVHRSRGVAEILGIDPDDLAPTVDAWSERIHSEDFVANDMAVKQAFVNGTGWATTYRIRDSRGLYRSILERGVIQRGPAGDPLRAVGCCVDVSEIKRLTDLLAETQRAAQVGGWEYSYATRELTWTDEMFRIYDTAPADFAVSWESMLARCGPESRQRFDEAFARAEAGGRLDIELEITTLAGKRLWVRMVGLIEKLGQVPCRAFGSVQNVQAQKMARIALENSTEWLTLSMNMAHMNAWRWDKSRDVIEFAIVGHEVQAPTALSGVKRLLARVHPKDRATVKRAVESAFEGRVEMHAEFRLKTKDGRFRSLSAIARPLFDGGTVPIGLVGVTQDVTARRESEARLRRSEELLRATTANTADTLLLVDQDLRIRFINRAVGDLKIEQIIGRDLNVVLPEAARPGVEARLRQVLKSGESATYEFDSVTEAGPQYFENRAVLVRDEDVGTNISITMRNITERKRMEQEILDVSSRERQTIGHDLHDGLGQELTGVALMLRGLASRIQRQCPEAIDYVNEIVGTVNQSIESARSLAHGLLPVRTDTGGLPFALRALAARSRHLYGLEVHFRADIRPALTLGETSASHLYRIVQEALTNASRHGEATLVEILLSVTKNRFLLRITDDGKGIAADARPAAGMGLKIMQYRASMIGAKFEIAPNEPRGTVVRITGEQPLGLSKLQAAHTV